MKFFIDTANIDEIKEANSMGMVDGVTTNPSLIAKEGRDFETVIREICDIVDGPISAEVISPDTEGMLKEARHLATIHKNIVVKIPMTVDGLKAVRHPVRGGDPHQCDPGFLAPPGSHGGQGRRHLCEPLCGAAG